MHLLSAQHRRRQRHGHLFFCALVESCGVTECHAHCLDELKTGADCILREVGCDTCSVALSGSSPADGTTATPATSYPEVGADVASGGVGFPGFFGFAFVSFISMVYAAGIM